MIKVKVKGDDSVLITGLSEAGIHRVVDSLKFDTAHAAPEQKRTNCYAQADNAADIARYALSAVRPIDFTVIEGRLRGRSLVQGKPLNLPPAPPRKPLTITFINDEIVIDNLSYYTSLCMLHQMMSTHPEFAEELQAILGTPQLSTESISRLSEMLSKAILNSLANSLAQATVAQIFDTPRTFK